VLGYDVDRSALMRVRGPKLAVNAAEAERVRGIYDRTHGGPLRRLHPQVAYPK
jgi:hypothetical protein